MSSIEAAGFWIALNAFLLIYLSARVAGARVKYKINLGDGDNPEMAKAIRTHGNYIEYAPVALIGLLTLALLDAGAVLVHIVGAMFFFARLSHLLGLGVGAWSRGRAVGTIFTMVSLLVTGLAILYFSLRA